MIKVFLVEDHHVVRNGIKKVMEQSGLYQVVAETSSAEDALGRFADGVKADILLTDINLPGMGGLELIAEVTKNYPEIKSVALTMHDSDKYAIKAFKAGARGYLLKSVSPEEMIFALQHVFYRMNYLSAELAYRNFERYSRLPADGAAEANPEQIQLSDRERQVLELLARGGTNQQIADALFTSRRTVEGHRRSLLIKTGTGNTVALMYYAVRNKLIN
ncbi:MAG TPA: response regulator transcription factor [Mucilaginibacter sp.]|jgi:DNA-binding NarL/FixJ family response regulator